MRTISRIVMALAAVSLLTSSVAQEANAPTLEQLGEMHLSDFVGSLTLGDADRVGYGSALSWGMSYRMVTLNLLYEATGDTQYLDKQLELIQKIFTKRDCDLATKYTDPGKYQDFQRARLMKAWGTGSYSKGQYTCWAVHTGMTVYPMAEFVRIVRAGGDATATYAQQVEQYVPLMEEAVKEYDAEWRDGPEAGQGYYLFPESDSQLSGQILPLNQMNAPGRALFALYDITGKPEYKEKAEKLAAFMKSKLTHIEDGDHYAWAYWAKPPDAPPSSGEDVSHAAINAHFMYVAWEHGAVFDDTDMQRLGRTFTVGLYLGDGQFSGNVGRRRSNDKYTGQLARWTFLARFDPAVEQQILEYVGAHLEGDGALSPTTGSMTYGFLLRARHLRQQDQAEQ